MVLSGVFEIGKEDLNVDVYSNNKGRNGKTTNRKKGQEEDQGSKRKGRGDSKKNRLVFHLPTEQVKGFAVAYVDIPLL